MTPKDFVAALEASGYSVMKFMDDAPPKGDFRILHPDNISEGWVVARHDSPTVTIKDVPGEQWEVFGWCVKELELLGYEVKVEGPIPGVDSTWAVGARLNKKSEWTAYESDTATGAARQVLASVLEGK